MSPSFSKRAISSDLLRIGRLLVSFGVLIKKGVTEIFHDKPRAYYSCLLSMDRDGLLSLLRHHRLNDFKEHDFISALRGTALDLLPADDPGGADAVPHLEDVPCGDDALHPDDDPAPGVAAAAGMLVPPPACEDLTSR